MINEDWLTSNWQRTDRTSLAGYLGVICFSDITELLCSIWITLSDTLKITVFTRLFLFELKQKGWVIALNPSVHGQPLKSMPACLGKGSVKVRMYGSEGANGRNSGLCTNKNSDLCSNCKLRAVSIFFLGLWYRMLKALLLLNVTQKLGVTAEATSKSDITEVKTEDKFCCLEWIYLFAVCKMYLLCSQAHKHVSW